MESWLTITISIGGSIIVTIIGGVISFFISKKSDKRRNQSSAIEKLEIKVSFLIDICERLQPVYKPLDFFADQSHYDKNTEHYYFCKNTLSEYKNILQSNLCFISKKKIASKYEKVSRLADKLLDSYPISAVVVFNEDKEKLLELEKIFAEIKQKMRDIHNELINEIQQL